MRKIRDLTGQTFGRLTVIAQVGKNKSGQGLREFSCTCGNPKKNIGGMGTYTTLLNVFEEAGVEFAPQIKAYLDGFDI